MPYIFFQINEGIAKFFTLIIESPFNKIMEFKCNTCIIMGYLHSPSNIKIYFKYSIPCQYIMKFMFSNLFIHLAI